MRIKFTASGSICSFTVGRLRFHDGDEADLPENEARKALKDFPDNFKMVHIDGNKMMKTGQDKCL